MAACGSLAFQIHAVGSPDTLIDEADSSDFVSEETKRNIN